MPKLTPTRDLPELGSAAFGSYLRAALSGPLKPHLSDRTLGVASGLRPKLDALFNELRFKTDRSIVVAVALERFRLLRGMTQAEVADRAGITRPYMSLLESSSREPSLPMLEKLSAALDVPMSALIMTSPTQKNFAAWAELDCEATELLKDDIIRAWEPRNTEMEKLAMTSAGLIQVALSPYLGSLDKSDPAK